MLSTRKLLSIFGGSAAGLLVLIGACCANGGTISRDNKPHFPLKSGGSFTATAVPKPETSGSHCHNGTWYAGSPASTYVWVLSDGFPPAETGTNASVQVRTDILSGGENDKTASVAITDHYLCPYDDGSGVRCDAELATKDETTPAAVFTVFDIKSKTEKQVPEIPDDRETIGVCEVVSLEMKPTDIIVTWTLSGGTRGSVSRGPGSTSIYTASDLGCSQTVSVKFANGDSGAISFGVVAPTFMNLDQWDEWDTNKADAKDPGCAGSKKLFVKAQLNWYVQPEYVNFENITVQEDLVLPSESIAWGYFKPTTHWPGGGEAGVSSDLHYGLGWKVNPPSDLSETQLPYPPAPPAWYISGSLTWDIPYHYMGDGHQTVFGSWISYAQLDVDTTQGVLNKWKNGLFLGTASMSKP